MIVLSGCGDELTRSDFPQSTLGIVFLSDSLVSDRLSPNIENPGASIVTLKFRVRLSNLAETYDLYGVGVDSMRIHSRIDSSVLGTYRFEEYVSESPRVDLVIGEVDTITVFDRSGANDIPHCTADHPVWVMLWLSDDEGETWIGDTGPVVLMCFPAP